MAEIKYEDFFDANINQGLEALNTDITSLVGSVRALKDEVKGQAKELALLLRAQQSGSKEAKNLAKATQELAKVYDQLTKEEQDMEYLASTMVTTDRERLQVANQALKMAREQETSYNRLSAQYNVVKKALNAMTVAERESTESGRQLVQRSREIYEEMKRLQEATGKHTLSVGDYSKAMRGLNIATTQVLREMPTIANSWSQFIIAIGNNLPILADQMALVRAETGSLTMVMKGLVSAIFSWQTALLVVLTVLPGIVKKLQDKKKAQSEDNFEMEYAISLEKKLIDAHRAEADAIDRKIGKINILLGILEQEGEWNDRKEASLKAISRLTGIQIKDYQSARQEIMNYIAILEKQAMAEEKISQIMELRSDNRKAEAEIAKAEANEEYREASKLVTMYEQRLNEAQEKLKNTTDKYAVVLYANQVTEYEKSLKKQREVMKKYTQYTYKDIESNNATISQLSDELTAELIDNVAVVENKVTETTKTIKEEFIDLWGIIRGLIITDDLGRSLNDLDIKYKKIFEDAKKAGASELEIATILEAKERDRVEIYRRNWIAETNERKEYYSKEVKDAISQADKVLKVEKNRAEMSHRNEQARAKAIGRAERNYWQTRIDVAEDAIAKMEDEIEGYEEQLEMEDANSPYIEIWRERIEILRQGIAEYEGDMDLFLSNLAKAEKQILTGQTAKGSTSRRKGGWLYSILYGEAEKEDKPTAELANFVSQLESVAKKAISYMNDIIAKRKELADMAVESARKEAESARQMLDYEMQARANGYASNIEYARKEYEERLAIQKKAQAESERLEKLQEAVDTASQISSLVTATANLLKGYSSIPILGQALAIAAITAMWGTFTGAKIMASQVARAKTYGEGGVEYMNYGGSHASGNDIDFGRTRDGRSRRVERGEIVGIINKRNVGKYGVGKVSDIINSLNQGTFEEKYGLAFGGGTMVASGVDLSNIEKGIGQLVEQGNTRVVMTSDGRIEYSGNNKRIIHS